MGARGVLLGAGILTLGAAGVLLWRKTAEAKEKKAAELKAAAAAASAPPVPVVASYGGKSGTELEKYKAEALGHQKWFGERPDWMAESGPVIRNAAANLGYKKEILSPDKDNGRSIVEWRKSDAAKMLQDNYKRAVAEPEWFATLSLDTQRGIIAFWTDPLDLYTAFSNKNVSPPAVLTGQILDWAERTFKERGDFVTKNESKWNVTDAAGFRNGGWFNWPEERRLAFLKMCSDLNAKG